MNKPSLEKKPYHVGISTGFWKIGKDPALLGLAMKIGGIGATGGIQFVQVDLETVAEFAEPDIEQQIKRMKEKLGMFAGLHGEIGELMALDSAEKRIWDQTHKRLCQTVKWAAKLGFFYVNVHFSNRQLISFTEAQHRTQGYFYPVVGPNGRGLPELVKGNPAIYNEAKKRLSHRLRASDTWHEEVNKVREQKAKEHDKRVKELYDAEVKKNPQESKEAIKRAVEHAVAEQIRREIREATDENEDFFFHNVWLNLKDTEAEKYQLEDGEWGAFHLVAHWMKARNDPLWTSIARGKDPAQLYHENENEFCAAVASKYLEGHITTKNWANKEFLEGMSVKEWCEAKGLYLLFENPESGEGAEGLYRLYDPQHFYHTIKQLNSEYIKITIDFEHMVSQQLDPNIVLPKLPSDFGKLIFLFHLGEARPYGGTAHIPIARGSVAQEQIYKWLYICRQKGWKKGYMMFERGGGRAGRGQSNFEVFEDSVLALKAIANTLPKNIEPKKLPMEFFGITMENKGVWSRQQVLMREHAWDPLEGVLNVPEEKHTFLGRVAVEKGKAQEWEKRKFR